MSTLHVGIDQRFQIVIAGILVSKESEELASNEPGRCRMVGKNVYHILVIKVTCMPKVRLHQVIVILWVIARGQSFDMPAGKCSSAFVDILLRVMTKAKRKQFHEFTRIIFVRSVSSILREIKVEEHSRVTCDTQQNVIERIKRMVAQELILNNHTHISLSATNLVVTTRQHSMPEESHFLQKWALCPGHTQ